MFQTQFKKKKKFDSQSGGFITILEYDIYLEDLVLYI